MPARTLPSRPQTYAQLRDAVIAVVVKGRRAIDRAWLETYHETGRLINEHILRFRDRADYGAKVYERLAEDTGISKRTLHECAQFHRCFPIARHVAQLGWNRCRLLCQVDDPKRRDVLTAQAVKNNWSSGEIAERVRSHNAVALAADDDPAPAPEQPVELLQPRCGTPGLRRVIERLDGLNIDLGFKNYAALPAAISAKLKANDIVRWDEDGVRKIPDATTAQLFTYRATIRKIVDGDTLDITLTLAPGFTRDLKRRLRGIDCPEIDTAAGRAAKAFVANLLAPGDEVIVCTTKPDKYDRYLADVFVATAAAKPSAISIQLTANRQSPTADYLFLNNALLTAGHAVPYDGDAKEQ